MPRSCAGHALTTRWQHIANNPNSEHHAVLSALPMHSTYKHSGQMQPMTHKNKACLAATGSVGMNAT
jgi:hypothetical protein